LPWGIHIVVALLACAALGSAQAADDLARRGADPRSSARPTSTFEKLLPLALAGDPEVQNFLGFMFYYGEGVARDFDEAHRWFHEAAEQGNVNAQLNLGLFHGATLPEVPAAYKDLEEAAVWLQRVAAAGPARAPEEHTPIRMGELDIGEKVYATFCSGCHGMSGVAAYPGAPSFAKGERLDRSDHDLAHTVINGKNSMPPWGATLSRELLESSLAYIRATYGHPQAAESGASRPRVRTDAGTGEPASGARNYRTYCAGCHGFNGVAYYVNSPSFAFGDRLEKNDQELRTSIAKGRGIMPSWEMMLSAAQIDGIVAFIRTLNVSYRRGIASEMGKPPPLYFRFRPLGETGDEWLGADPFGAQPPGRR
jgi:mono/diheme cytochrome c family protein